MADALIRLDHYGLPPRERGSLERVYKGLCRRGPTPA